jgi:hypothetical protein
MALSILDGNQSATTLSTILSSGQHITAHTVVSLGSQAITDMQSAVSGSVVSIPSLPAISGTVTANVPYVSNLPTGQNQSIPVVLITDEGKSIFDVNQSIKASINGAIPAGTNSIGVVTIGAGTVTIGAGTAQIGSVTASISGTVPISISSVTVGNSITISSLPALVAGTAQIGSVTASISGTVPISISSVTIGNSVTIASLPALVAGTAQIGSVTASISNSVVTFYPLQGTTVTNTNFTSTTASTTLVSAVAGREVLTVFNEGAGNLHISPGATCTTIAYQVRLSSGDYWECPAGQLSLAHTAVFATAGTARVTEVS